MKTEIYRSPRIPAGSPASDINAGTLAFDIGAVRPAIGWTSKGANRAFRRGRTHTGVPVTATVEVFRRAE